MTIAAVTKPDGSPCLSFESYIDSTMACERMRHLEEHRRPGDRERLPQSLQHPDLVDHVHGHQRFAELLDNGALTGGPYNDCCDITGLGIPTCSYPQCTSGGCAAPN